MWRVVCIHRATFYYMSDARRPIVRESAYVSRNLHIIPHNIMNLHWMSVKEKK